MHLQPEAIRFGVDQLLSDSQGNSSNIADVLNGHGLVEVPWQAATKQEHRFYWTKWNQKLHAGI